MSEKFRAGETEKSPGEIEGKKDAPRGWENVDMEKYLAEFLQKHPPEAEIPPEARRECGPDIADFEAMIASFEARHDLDALHAITNLSGREAFQHPVRAPARLDLQAIIAKLSRMWKETDIDDTTYTALLKRIQPLYKAVGTINNDVVDHVRETGDTRTPIP